MPIWKCVKCNYRCTLGATSAAAKRYLPYCPFASTFEGKTVIAEWIKIIDDDVISTMPLPKSMTKP